MKQRVGTGMGEEHTGLTAEAIIRMLNLKPHPEGGFFRETFRDRNVDQSGRAASTAIYYLLRRGEESHWHRVDAAEIWHWYAGSVLQLEVVESPDSIYLGCQLGSMLDAGERPQFVVPPGFWQRARTLGDWTLVGCTVAPAFEFGRFELAPDGLLPSAWR